MSYIVSGLPVETFQPLFNLDDAQLAAHGVIRRVSEPGAIHPCRITLKDAAPGETVLLLNYEHQNASTPYRSSYAIYVNQAARETCRMVDTLPPVLRGRPIALRAFDEAGMLVDATVLVRDDVEAGIARLFVNPAAAYLHAHNAAHGCYAARLDRA